MHQESRYDRPPRTRAALAVAGLLVATAAVYLVLRAFSIGSVTLHFVDEVVASAATFHGKAIRVSGTFVAGSRALAGPGRTRFAIESRGVRLVVVAPDEALPAGFDVAGRNIFADGRLLADGVFHASTVTTGCPSRYVGRDR